MATTNPPSKTAVTEWCKVFHAMGTESYTSSVTFTKQLTVVALSIITYIKNAFPEDCYTIETFAGLKLKILKTKCNDELAQFLSTSLTQAFDALDKKYLHQLALCFYEDDCKLENLVEYTIFEYSYSPEGVGLNIHSKNQGSEQRSVHCSFEGVQQRTTLLIRTCLMMMQAYQQGLPSTVDISLRLYYNDDAPEGYQAPGYRNDEGDDHLGPTLSKAFQLGWVETPYHKIIAKSYMRDFVQDSCEALPSPNTPQMTLTQPMDFNVAVSIERNETEGLQLLCPCNKYEDIGQYSAPLLITCQYCRRLQHAVCFGLSAERAGRLRAHCCAACSQADPRRAPTDPRLTPLSARNRECLCIFRRTLDWCGSLRALAGSGLADRFGVSAVNAAKLMKLLETSGVVAPDPAADLVTPRTINHEQLRVALGNYFQSDDDPASLADRLLAETFGSQDSQGSSPDPLGDVLTTLEKTSLHHTSTLGRVIENPDLNKTMDTDDPTLRQYREVILSGAPVAEDLPLAGSRDVEQMLKGPKKGGKRKVESPKVVEKPGRKLRAGVGSKRAKR